jgi:7-cyano-7-deazaguanine synthase in queuosine biosynthesis
MPNVYFHFCLGQEDVRMPDVPEGTTATEVQLIPNQRSLGHCLGTTIDQLSDLNLAPSEIGVDFLLLGSAILTADKHASRARYAEDSWTRELALSLPVSDPARWQAVSAKLTQALGFLTGDRWTLEFRARPIAYVTLAPPPPTTVGPIIDTVSLFSGGLDSFIGAVDLLQQGRRVLLVSHSAVGSDSVRQRHLFRALEAVYPGASHHLRGSIRFTAKHLGETTGENTERSRSFLFFALAVLAASALPTISVITVPENGLISLNVPLEDLRLGSLSTRTTHPYFLARMNEVMSALGLIARFANPYQFATKGEMVRDCRNRALLAQEVSQTISCSSPNNARIRYDGKEQCGYCVPCLIRRAALHQNVIPDTTEYGITSLQAQPLASDQKAGEHVRAFQSAILRLANSPIRASVIAHESGPLNDYQDSYSKFGDLYLRGMREVETLLQGVVTRPHA